MNILIVDDEPAYRMLLEFELQSEKRNIITAEHGEDALEKMSNTKIDFIISDIYMPVMDGIKFHNAVRSKPEYEQIPFLFVSGYTDMAVDTIKNPKIEAFLSKSKPVETISAWINYLTTPEAQRPKVPPGFEEKPSVSHTVRDKSSIRDHTSR
jgi:CheY-like chemotaxis protein